MRRAILRLVLSVAFSGALPVVCSRLPRINDTTAALLLVLCILGISARWGWPEALTAAIVGGISYDYYFLGPPGFSITAPEFGVALVALVITAIVTGRLTAQLVHRRIEAVERQNEIEKLHRLAEAMTGSGSLERLLDQLAEIFGAEGVALYDKQSGHVIRSGPGSAAISDQRLRETEPCGPQRMDAGSVFSFTPIRDGDEPIGTIGISGAKLSESLLSAISVNVGLALVRLRAIEMTTAAEIARRADDLKSAVLDAMAHDIRNPLNSIKIAATTLLSEHAGSQMFQRDMLTIINEEVTRLDRSFDAAVQLARVEANELSFKKEPQNPAELIAAAIEETSALAGRRHIQELVPESLPLVECDRDLVIRVLKQLLSNALKYSPDDSPLTVSAEFSGAAVVIDVVDRGAGVSDEERDRIFEKYYRGRAAQSGTPGTGLGLASARAITQAHGGEIWMTSPSAGGAAFHVSLPATYGQANAG